MYKIFFIKNIINESIINIKFDLSDIDYYIHKYNLLCKGVCKIYYLNNLEITSDSNKLEFYKIIDKNIIIKEKHLIIEQEKTIMEPFLFYDSDYEETYELYENNIDNLKIILRKYKNYFELEFLTNNLNDFYKL